MVPDIDVQMGMLSTKKLPGNILEVTASATLSAVAMYGSSFACVSIPYAA